MANYSVSATIPGMSMNWLWYRTLNPTGTPGYTVRNETATVYEVSFNRSDGGSSVTVRYIGSGLTYVVGTAGPQTGVFTKIEILTAPTASGGTVAATLSDVSYNAFNGVFVSSADESALAGNDTLNDSGRAQVLFGRGGADTYQVTQAGTTVFENGGNDVDTVRTALATYSLQAIPNVENLAGTASGTIAQNLTGNSLANTIADSTFSTGQATLSGLAGDDTYEIASATAIILENSNEGTDTVRTALATYSLAAIANVENLTGTMPGPHGQNLSGNGLNNIITASSVNAFGSGAVLSGLDGNDTLFGFDYDDALYGGVGDDSMVGGFGNDNYIVDSIYDEVVELDGEGIDSIQTDLAGYFLPSGVENLNFNDGSTAHIGYGNALDNFIAGNNGDDTLNGGEGNDSLIGGSNGAFGDTADFSDASGMGVTVSLAIAGAQAVGGGLGTDTLSGIENMIGSALADSLTGDGNVNTLTGGGSVDTLSGGLGNDTIFGGDGNDNISGDGGADFMYGGTGDDRFVVDTYAGEAVVEFANEGTDVVYATIDYTVGLNIEQIIMVEGSAAVNAGGGEDGNVIIGNSAANVIYAYGGNDVLAGGDGDDSLLGMDGNDAIDGQGGNDQMIGGLGDDSFVIDSISDAAAEFAGEGIDTVYAEIDYTLGGNIEQLILREGTAAVNGAGDANNNTIIGNSAINTIYGNDGADTLYGFANNDVLVGGNGNDIFDGGTGNDNLSGNADADPFKFAAGDGLDVINDFSHAEGDQLLVSSALAADFAAFQAAGSTVNGNAVFSFGGGTQTITLTGVNHTSLVAADVQVF